MNIVASFDRRGDYVYTGNARGRVLILDAETLAVKASYKISQGTASNTAVKSIEFARRGSCFLINTSDRVIRVYDSTEVLACGKDGEPEPIQKLQDLVNKTMWKKCCFSGDGEYVCAGSARQHALYVWEKSIGNLVKILHGTKGELLLDVVVSILGDRSYYFLKIDLNVLHSIFGILIFYSFEVASSASNNRFHIFRSCVNLGTKSSRELVRLCSRF